MLFSPERELEIPRNSRNTRGITAPYRLGFCTVGILTIGTYVFYDTFASPTIGTYVFYDTFASPTIGTHVFYDTLEAPVIGNYVFYDAFQPRES